MRTFTCLALALLLALSNMARCADDAPAPAKKPAEPKKAIYDEKADAKALIAKAVAAARKENRRVLIQWGGNWCSWCHLLHERLRSDRTLARTLLYEYDLVLIDSRSNMELAEKYGADLKKNGVPYLTVLDADGKVITNQASDPFETKEGDKNGHDPKKLQDFLTSHKTLPRKAEEVLAAGLAEAVKSDRSVFVHFGAPWCGWCHRLEDWLALPTIAALMEKDFVDVKIDVDRMEGGKDVYARYCPSQKGGIPWFAMLDGKGKALATSDNMGGNIGFPNTEPEIAHFVAMLKTSKRHLTDQDIEELKKSLTPAAKAAPGR